MTVRMPPSTGFARDLLLRALRGHPGCTPPTTSTTADYRRRHPRLRSWRDAGADHASWPISRTSVDVQRSPGARPSWRTPRRPARSLGVAGFRIDAAGAHGRRRRRGDRRLRCRGHAHHPSEVIRGARASMQPEEYTGFGEVFEFQLRAISPRSSKSGVVRRSRAPRRRPPARFPADTAVVFVDNHDTERGEADVTYRDGAPVRHRERADARRRSPGRCHRLLGLRVHGSRRRALRAGADDKRRPPASCAGRRPTSDLVYDDGERTCVRQSAGDRRHARVPCGRRRRAPRLEGVDEGDAYGFERQGRGVVAVNAGAEEQTHRGPHTRSPAGSTATRSRAGANR